MSCAIDTRQPPPYPVTFRFENRGDTTAYLHEGCSVEFHVTSCADNYTTRLTLTPACSLDCRMSDTGCIACEPCSDRALAIAPGEFVDYEWDGQLYTFEQRDGCLCHNTQPAPPGRYRVELARYPSESFATTRTCEYPHVEEFTLPAPSPIVTVGFLPAVGLCE